MGFTVTPKGAKALEEDEEATITQQVSAPVVSTEPTAYVVFDEDSTAVISTIDKDLAQRELENLNSVLPDSRKPYYITEVLPKQHGNGPQPVTVDPQSPIERVGAPLDPAEIPKEKKFSVSPDGAVALEDDLQNADYVPRNIRGSEVLEEGEAAQLRDYLEVNNDVETAVRSGGLAYALNVTKGYSAEDAKLMEEVSKREGVPPSHVLNNKEEYKKWNEAVKNYNSLLERHPNGELKHPSLIRWMSNPKNTAEGRDNTEVLKKVESIARGRFRGKLFPLMYTFADASKRVLQGLEANVFVDLQLRTVETLNEEIKYLRDSAKELKASGLDTDAVEKRLIDIELDIKLKQNVARIRGNVAKVAKKHVDSYEFYDAARMEGLWGNDQDLISILPGVLLTLTGYKVGSFLGKIGQLGVAGQGVTTVSKLGVLKDAATGVSRLAPQIGASGLAGQGLGFIANYMHLSGKNYVDLDNAGVEEKRNAVFSHAMAAIEAGIDILPLSRLVKAIGSVKTAKTTGMRAVVKNFLKLAFSEGSTEFIQGFPNEFGTIWAKAEKEGRTFDESVDLFIGRIPEVAKQGLYEAALMMVFIGVGGSVGLKAAWNKQKLNDGNVEAFKKTQEALQELKIPLEKQETFVNQVQEDVRDVTEIYVPVDFLQSYFKETPGGFTDFVAEMDAVKDLDVARETGEIELNYAKFLTKFGGTELGVAALPVTRFGMNGVSTVEIVNLHKDMAKEVNDKRAELAAMIAEENSGKDHPSIVEMRKRIMQKGNSYVVYGDNNEILVESSDKAEAEAELAVLNAELPEGSLPYAVKEVLGFGESAEYADRLQEIGLAGWKGLAKGEGLTIDQFLDRENINIKVHGKEAIIGTAADKTQDNIVIVKDKDGTKILFQVDTDSTAFEKFFGESIVTDKDGAPRIVYHGAKAKFDEFSFDTIGQQGRSEGPGFYFTSDKETAKSYQGPEGQLVEAYVSINKPIGYANYPFSEDETGRLFQAIAEAELRDDPDLEDIDDTKIYSNGYTREMSLANETALDQVSEFLNLGIGPEIVLRSVKDTLGYDGFTSQGYDNQGTAGGDIFIPFTPEQIKSVSNTGNFDATEKSIYLAKKNNLVRGAVSFGDAETTINLFKSAELSTLLHEQAHTFFKRMEIMIASGIASPELINDYKISIDFMGGTKNTEGIEKWVRGFEAYVMEGKAPSISLIGAFSRFKDILKTIYTTAKGLNVEISDEIRGVFDRLLASDIEIAEAKAAYNSEARIRELVGLSPEAIADLKIKEKKAKLTEQEKQEKQAIAAFRKATGSYKKYKEQATAEVAVQQVYKAIKTAQVDGGLDPQDVEDIIGTEGLKALRKKHRGLIFKKLSDGGPKTYHKLTLDYGGIDSKTLTPDERKLFKESGVVGVYRKTGYGLDQIAQEMADNNQLIVPSDRNGGDFLKELLIEKAPYKEEGGFLDDIEGESAQNIALEAGYETPEIMLNEMLLAEARGKAIETRTKEIMDSVEAEIKRSLKAGESFPGERAIHNDDSLVLIVAEAEHLAQKIAGKGRRSQGRLDAAVIKRAAQNIIAEMPVWKATAYNRFRSAEARASQKAEQLLVEASNKTEFPEVDALLMEAHKQMKIKAINHAMVLEGFRAREKKLKVEGKYQTTKLKKRVAKTENSYANAALDAISFFGLNDKVKTGNEEILPNLAKLDETLSSVVPNWVAQKRLPKNYRNYRDLTMKDFIDLDSAIDSIIKYGSNKKLDMESTRNQTIEEDKNESMKNMNSLKSKRLFSKYTDGVGKHLSFGAFVDGLLTEGKMMQYVFEHLDNFQFQRGKGFGVMSSIFNSFTKAETVNAKHYGLAVDKLTPALETIGKAGRRIETLMGNKPKKFANAKGFQESWKAIFEKGHKIEGVPLPVEAQRVGITNWTVESRFMYLLNMGNLSSAQVLNNSYAYTPEQEAKILEIFTNEEIEAAQVVWDSLDLLYPSASKVHFNIYNRDLGKVEARQFTVKSASGDSITLKGGYMPLAYDSRFNDRAAKNAEERAQREQDILNNRKSNVNRTKKSEDGFIKMRREGVSLHPKLSMDVLFTHIGDVSRFISHAEILRDTNRLTTNVEWATKVKEVVGDNVYNSIRDWVAHQTLVVNETSNPYVNWLSKQKQKSTIAILGMNIPVGPKQRASMWSAAEEMGDGGFKWLIKGAITAGFRSTVYGSTKSGTWDNIIRLSPYMKTRQSAVYQEAAKLNRRIDPFVKKFKIPGFTHEFTHQDVKDWTMEWIQLNDRAAVAPIWLGAFNKYLHDNNTMDEAKAVEYADNIIQRSQPSSLPVDLAPIQRGSSQLKLFVSFMTWTLKAGNRFQNKNRAWREGALTFRQYSRHVMYELFFASWTVAVIDSVIKSADLPEWWEAITAPIEVLLSGVPFIREIPSYYKYSTGQIGGSTAFEGIQRILKAAWSVKKSAVNDREWRKTYYDMARAVELQVGIPAATFFNNLIKYSKNITGDKKKK